MPVSSTHHLHISFFDNSGIAHAVFVFEVPFQRDGDDLHIVVGMGAEPHALGHSVVIEDAQYAEVSPLRVVIISEAKGVMGIQPAMIGVATGIGFVQYCFSWSLFFLIG